MNPDPRNRLPGTDRRRESRSAPRQAHGKCATRAEGAARFIACPFVAKPENAGGSDAMPARAGPGPWGERRKLARRSRRGCASGNGIPNPATAAKLVLWKRGLWNRFQDSWVSPTLPPLARNCRYRVSIVVRRFGGMGWGRVDVSVIVPTFDERDALRLLAPRLEAALRPYAAEILVVDDASPDGTAAEVRARMGPGSPWRVLERVGKRGLASAVLDGFAESRGDIVVVMDADGSHPPEVLRRLVEPIREGRAEFVLASRHVSGGEDRGLNRWRRGLSWGASVLARPITSVRDPMSGFFAVKRNVLGRARLTPIGYKIGLEVLVKCRPKPVEEVPFRFEARVAGESKLGGGEIANYLRHLARLYVWRGSSRIPTWDRARRS
jgi:hypothetical protein